MAALIMSGMRESELDETKSVSYGFYVGAHGSIVG